MAFLENKVVIITGGTEGIGRALVDFAIAAGAKVATCARNTDKLYQLQTNNAHKSLFTFTADVSIENECERFIQQAVKAFGRIDILINNAGISMRALFKETELQTLKKVMDINFWGSVYCTKYALPFIEESKGTIVGISSIAGYRGLPGRTGYSASKFALNGFYESLRTELLTSGTNVMWVCPGFTSSNIRYTALNKNAEPQGLTPMDEENMMPARECARIIYEAIEKKKRNLVFTIKDKRTVIVNRLMPSLADKLVRNFFYKGEELIK